MSEFNQRECDEYFIRLRDPEDEDPELWESVEPEYDKEDDDIEYEEVA